jgi:hypothetical protein
LTTFGTLQRVTCGIQNNFLSHRRLSECHKKFFEKGFRNFFRNEEGFKIISAETESTDKKLEIMVRMDERTHSSLSNPKPWRIIM